MKKRLTYIFLILIFFLGIIIMLYPFISSWWNQRKQDVIISDYTQAYEKLVQEEISAELERCMEYNKGLLGSIVLTDPFDPDAKNEATEEYEALLNINGSGMMGYIEIPKINVSLSIYHGTSSDVLKKGVGHLANTSLPVGGTASHAVLSAHTGYPTAELFNDLVELEEGDIFYLTILGEKLAYQIDQIKIVNPDNTSDLVIDRDEDYVTLVTCTPYGVNSHRLLVRGTRVPYEEDDKAQNESLANGINDLLYIIGAGIVVIIFITIKAVKRWKRMRRNHYEE